MSVNNGGPKGRHAVSILVQPLHSFSHGHYVIMARGMVRGRVRMYDEDVTQHGIYRGRPRLQLRLV